MKPQRAFTPGGIAAVHCKELLRSSRHTVSDSERLAALGKAVSQQLAPALAGICGGKRPHVRALAAETLDHDALSSRIGAVAGNFLLRCDGIALVASVEAIAVFAQLERSFGGTGDGAGDVPRSFPLSAQLMLERLGVQLGGVIGSALDKPCDKPRFDPDYAGLAAFRQNEELAVLPLEIAPASGRPWEITLALPARAVANLCAGKGSPQRVSTPRSPLDEPFAGLPLPLEARLVDMRVRLSVLAALAPGMVLPVAVARNVPLTVGGTCLAEGTLGERDDRVALKITQSHIGKDAA